MTGRCGGDEADLELLLRCQSGDQEAMESLCVDHAGLIAWWGRKLAERFSYWARFNADDITQDGMIGFMKAARQYQTDGHVKFHTYARRCFEWAALDGSEMRLVSRYQRETRKKAIRAHDRLAVRLGRKPLIEEISDEAELSIIQVRNVFETLSPFLADLDEVEEGDLPAQLPHRTAPDPGQYLYLEEAIRQLEPLDAQIIVLYYYYGTTDEQVGDKLGLTKDNAKKRRQRALEKLGGLLSDGGE